MEKIKVLRIKFKSTNDLLVEEKIYRKYGNFLEFAQAYQIDIKDRIRSYFELIDPRDYPKSAWDG